MKQVILEYAGAVIAVIGALSFFIVFHQFFTGENGVLGKILLYSIGEKSIAENSSFEEYMNDLPPSIVEKEGYEIVVNKKIQLKDCFEAKTQNNESLAVYLRNAWDMSGNPINLAISQDATTICVSEAGIYQIEIYAIGENGKETSKILKIVVNER